MQKWAKPLFGAACPEINGFFMGNSRQVAWGSVSQWCALSSATAEDFRTFKDAYRRSKREQSLSTIPALPVPGIAQRRAGYLASKVSIRASCSSQNCDTICRPSEGNTFVHHLTVIETLHGGWERFIACAYLTWNILSHPLPKCECE